MRFLRETDCAYMCLDGDVVWKKKVTENRGEGQQHAQSHPIGTAASPKVKENGRDTRRLTTENRGRGGGEHT